MASASPSGSTARSGRFPTDDIAVIDFTGGGGSQSDWDRLNSGQFVVLKDGQVITGQLTDVGGSSPLRLSFSVNGGNRDFPSNDVARIVLARPNDVTAPSTPSTGGGSSTTDGIMVPARQRWTPTGLTVRRGEALTVSATGRNQVRRRGGPQGLGGGSNERDPDNPIPNVDDRDAHRPHRQRPAVRHRFADEPAGARGRSAVPRRERHEPGRQRWVIPGADPARRRPVEVNRGFGSADHGWTGRGSRVDGTRITRIPRGTGSVASSAWDRKKVGVNPRPIHPVDPRNPRPVTPEIPVIRVPSAR